MVQIRSPVTGMVWKVMAQVGQELEVGATVLIAESMKMEIPVEMPRAGRLTRLLVNEEDAISEGQVVAEFEAHD
jgi:acetyl-CoA carboxylase biotin carboxyl carrier protein